MVSATEGWAWGDRWVQCQNGGPPAGGSAGGQRCYWTTNITPYYPGSDVVEAPPSQLAAACVRAYLRAKWTARF